MAHKKHRKRYQPEQITKILQEVDAGRSVDEICRDYGVSKGTYYNWKSRYGGMDVAEVQKMKALEAENARLKRLVADLSLDNQMLKEVASKKMVSPSDRRQMVTLLADRFTVSERRACRALSVGRSSIRYRSTRPSDDPLRLLMREAAQIRHRWGYRRLLWYVRSQGLEVGRTRFQRVYQEERLQLRKRRRRRKVAASRVPLHQPTGANEMLAMDFVHDRTIDGRSLKI